MRHLGRLIALALCALAASSARAEVVFDGTLSEAGPALPGVVGTTAVDYRIGAERGLLRGSNLFFSFSDFSIEAGRVGAIDGPIEVENVLARVTGGVPSHIDGVLGSAISGANVWLVNPSGVVFGPGARLVLRGGLHVSTADYLRFEDGSIFHATSPDAGPLSSAAPEAWGFLSARPASIEIDVSGKNLRTGRNNRLSLVAGDISIHAGTGNSVGFLWAQDARIDLVAAAPDAGEPLEVRLRAAGADTLELTGSYRGGSIAIDRGAVISSSGFNPANPFDTFSQPTDGAGDIRFVADSLVVADAEVHSETGGNEPGGNIDVDLSGDFLIRSSGEQPSGFFAGTGLQRGFLSAFGAGPGGKIDVRAQNIELLGRSALSTTSIGLGDAGAVSLHASDRVLLRGLGGGVSGAGIFSRTTLSGAGGAISIEADRLELSDGAGIVTEARRAGSGGQIGIDVGELSLRSGARIDSSIRSFADPLASGGTIDVRASREILIRGRESAEVFSGITAIAQGATDTLPPSTASAGDIHVRTPRLTLEDGGTISTQALGTGDGGSIRIEVDELQMDAGLISASAVEGQGGDIEIAALDHARLVGGSEISARASGAGDAGSIAFDAGRELELGGSSITTDSALSDGGDIEIRAVDLAYLRRSEITTSVTGGSGGSIDIDPEHVVLNESRVVARAGAGSGGIIRIVAGHLVRDFSSTIDASSDTGIDGSVTINSPEVDQNTALDALPSDFADAAALLRAACAARGLSGSGSFEVRTGARARPAPDAPLEADGPSARDRSGCAAEPPQ